MTIKSDVDWTEVRHSFPIFRSQVYLNTGTFGPLLQTSFERLCQQAEHEIHKGRANHEYYEILEHIREQLRLRLATVLSSAPEEIALTSSTTSGAHIVVNGLALSSADEILTTDLEHHTFVTSLRTSQAKVRIVKIAHLQPGEEVIAVSKAVNKNTALIAMSHVSWIDGRILDVKSVSDIGPPVFVDGAQSVGAIPSYVDELGCTFLTFPGQKWLLGPDATGGLYIRRSWHDHLKVALPSYYGHEPWHGQSVDVPLKTAKKFEAVPIPLPILAAFESALCFSGEFLVEGQQRAKRLTKLFRETISHSYPVITAPNQSTLVVFDPKIDADYVCRELANNNVIVRTVPPNNWLRVSIGYWNNEQDLELLLDHLGKL